MKLKRRERVYVKLHKLVGTNENKYFNITRCYEDNFRPVTPLNTRQPQYTPAEASRKQSTQHNKGPG